MQLVGIQIYNLDIARIKNQRNEILYIYYRQQLKFCVNYLTIPTCFGLLNNIQEICIKVKQIKLRKNSLNL